jgi:hypothetical protein
VARAYAPRGSVQPVRQQARLFGETELDEAAAHVIERRLQLLVFGRIVEGPTRCRALLQQILDRRVHHLEGNGEDLDAFVLDVLAQLRGQIVRCVDIGIVVLRVDRQPGVRAVRHQHDVFCRFRLLGPALRKRLLIRKDAPKRFNSFFPCSDRA